MKRSKKTKPQMGPTEVPNLPKIYSSTKPPLLYYSTLTKENKYMTRKYMPKYVKSLNCYRSHRIPSTIRGIKKVSHLQMDDPYYFRDRYLQSSKLIKILKPLRKHIRSIRSGFGSLKISELIHLPFLSELCLSHGYCPSWKKLHLLRNVQTLVLSFNSKHYSNNNQAPQRPLRRFGRAAVKSGRLKHLKVVANENLDKLAGKILEELYDYTPLFDHLKTFVLSYKSHFYHRSSLQCKPEVFSYVTHANLKQCFPFNDYPLSSFRRIQSIDMLLNEASIPEMAHIGTLDRLSSLKIRLSIKYKGEMENFMKTFTLPNSIELVDIDMEELSLENINRTPITKSKSFLKFLEQWKGKNKLTYLSLQVQDHNRGSAFISDFVSGILKHTKHLQTLETANSLRYYARVTPKIESLDLKFFWSAVNMVESSIRSVSIEDIHITSDGFEQIIETFQKKATVDLPFMADITGLWITDPDELEKLLLQLAQIPARKDLIVKVEVDIGLITGEVLKAKLMSFLTGTIQIQGNVYLDFINLSKKLAPKDVKQITTIINDHSKFKRLSITTKRQEVLLSL